jgi:hypothetical protein
MAKPNDTQQEAVINPDDHGAFINEMGEEVQITEEMILQACQSLEEKVCNHIAQAANDNHCVVHS